MLYRIIVNWTARAKNGMGRERRGPGTAAGPEVPPSTRDAYGEGRTRGEDRDPRLGRALGAAWPCLLSLWVDFA